MARPEGGILFWDRYVERVNSKVGVWQGERDTDMGSLRRRGSEKWKRERGMINVQWKMMIEESEDVQTVIDECCSCIMNKQCGESLRGPSAGMRDISPQVEWDECMRCPCDVCGIPQL